MSFARRSVSEYRLGPGDLIALKVFGVESLNQEYRIDSSGEISIPLIGAVGVAGMSQAEAEKKLRTLLEQRLIQNPQVTLFIREYRSQTIYVLGAIKSPGQYQISRATNLVDAIAMAGGLDPARASDIAIVQRPVADSPASGSSAAEPEKIQVDLRELLERGDLSQNVPLQGGDIIQVPERQIQVFYVIGEVYRPGVFQFPTRQDVYVTQALAQAGGPMRTAKTKKGLVLRFDESGKRQELAVNFADILKGKKADFQVTPNDIIFIPGSTFKNIGYGLLGIIPSTVSGSIVYGTIQ